MTRSTSVFSSSRTRIMASTRALLRHYADRGYSDALITPITKLSSAGRLVALTYEITPGKRTLPRTH